MKKITFFSVITFFIVYNFGYSQNCNPFNCQNQVHNPSFALTHNNEDEHNQFQLGWVPGWHDTHGTPDVVNDIASGNNFALMWIKKLDNNQNTICGEGIDQEIQLFPGINYCLEGLYRTFSDEIQMDVSARQYVPYDLFQIDCGEIPNPSGVIFSGENTAGEWANFNHNFTVPSQTEFLYIVPSFVNPSQVVPDDNTAYVINLENISITCESEAIIDFTYKTVFKNS